MSECPALFGDAGGPVAWARPPGACAGLPSTLAPTSPSFWLGRWAGKGRPAALTAVAGWRARPPQGAAPCSAELGREVALEHLKPRLLVCVALGASPGACPERGPQVQTLGDSQRAGEQGWLEDRPWRSSSEASPGTALLPSPPAPPALSPGCRPRSLLPQKPVLRLHTAPLRVGSAAHSAWPWACLSRCPFPDCLLSLRRSPCPLREDPGPPARGLEGGLAQGQHLACLWGCGGWLSMGGQAWGLAPRLGCTVKVAAEALRFSPARAEPEWGRDGWTFRPPALTRRPRTATPCGAHPRPGRREPPAGPRAPR